MVSSTDAAAVFSVLRGSRLHLRQRVGATLEVESGINDPMAVILTTILTMNLLAPGSLRPWAVPLDVMRELAIGLAAGSAIGTGGRELIRRVPLPASGLYRALNLSFASLAFAVATLAHGSGFLSVYTAGLVLAGAPGAGHIFTVVFFIVVANALVPGAT